MKLSLVVPVYNEEENLPFLHDAIQQVMNGMDKAWEVIFVDDGSRDKSLAVMERLVKQDPEHVRVVVFRRNFGQTAAITAGVLIMLWGVRSSCLTQICRMIRPIFRYCWRSWMKVMIW